MKIHEWSAHRLIEERGMKPLEAILTLDWIIREPDTALRSLKRGRDRFERKNRLTEPINDSKSDEGWDEELLRKDLVEIYDYPEGERLDTIIADLQNLKPPVAQAFTAWRKHHGMPRNIEIAGWTFEKMREVGFGPFAAFITMSDLISEPELGKRGFRHDRIVHEEDEFDEERVRTDLRDKYSYFEEEIEDTIAKMRSLTHLRRPFAQWTKTGAIPKARIEVIDLNYLIHKCGMNPYEAFDILDWLLWDPAAKSHAYDGFCYDEIIYQEPIQGVSNFPNKLEYISTLINRLSIQKSDDGTLKNSERKLLKSISNGFRRYAEEIRKIGPSNDTFPVTWIFQGILSSSRAIHDAGTLDKFPRWKTDGEPLLKLVSEASYSELSKLSDSGKH